MTQPPPWVPPARGPGWPPAPGRPPRRGTNGFAIAALVLGLLGGFLLSAIFAVVALVQIRTSGQAGRGLAVTGLVLSGLWAVVIVVVVAVAATTSANRDGAGQITAGGSVSATALRVGDCVNGLAERQNLLSLPAVPCADPHEGEVFAVFDLPPGPYPGAAAVDDEVNEECNARLTSYSAAAAADPDVGLFVVYPLEANWRAGDREVVCLASAAAGRTTGSLD